MGYKYSCGAIKDERQANYVLIVFVAVAIIISLFLFFGVGGSSEATFKGGSNPQNFEFR